MYRKSQKFVDDIVVLDFETTGLSPERNEIIQIGAIKFEKAKIVDQFARYAKASRQFLGRLRKLLALMTKQSNTRLLLKKVCSN